MSKSLFIATLLSTLLFYSCSPTSTDSTTSTTQFQVTLSSSPAEGGSVSPADGEYEEGNTLEISASPNEGWRFDHWEGDHSSSNSTTEITVDTDKNITAVFEKKSYELTVDTQGEGSVNEDIIQAKSYDFGTQVQLTAEPNEGWQFVKWQGDLTGLETPAKITVDNPKQVTAVFQKKAYPLTVNIKGQGSIAKDPVQQEYVFGATVELTASPASGWDFEKWEGDTTSTDNPVQLTIDGQKNVTAVFVEQNEPLFYLAVNGVTIKCGNAQTGDIGTVNGITYTKRDKSQITPSNAETTCTSGLTSTRFMFNGASSFNGDISSWDVSSVTDMRGMFFDATSFAGALDHWDVSNVTDMSFMFSKANSFDGYLNSWDVGSVTAMEGMFDGAGSFNQDLNNWDVSNVTNMVQMFRQAASFNGDISSWDVGSVTNMRGMFGQATLFNGDVSNWNVANVIYMDYMFTSAESFNQNLNSWDVSSVIAMDGMFSRATSFNGDLRDWNVGNVEPMDYMFQDAESFNRNIGRWDVSSATSMRYMFSGASFFDQDLSGWCVTNINSYPDGFSSGSPLSSSHRPVWGTCS
jgi:surface protein